MPNVLLRHPRGEGPGEILPGPFAMPGPAWHEGGARAGNPTLAVRQDGGSPASRRPRMRATARRTGQFALLFAVLWLSLIHI